MEMMQITPNEAKELEKLYNEAVASKQEQFVFKGHDLLTAYAKYVLEYLHTQMKF